MTTLNFLCMVAVIALYDHKGFDPERESPLMTQILKV